MIKEYLEIPFYLPNQSILRVLYEVSDYLRLNIVDYKKKLNNDFFSFLSKNDYHVPFDLVINFFQERIFIIEDGMHEPFICKE